MVQQGRRAASPIPNPGPLVILLLLASLSAPSGHLPTLPTAPSLQAPGSAFQYTYLEVGLGREDRTEADSLTLGASLEFNDTWFARFGYGLTSVEVAPLSLDATSLQVGLGLHTILTKQIDMYGVASYVDYSFDSTDDGVDIDTPGVDGYSYEVGTRIHASSWLELDLSYTVIDVDDFSTPDSLGINALIDVTSAISFSANYSTSDDSDLLGVGLRVHF